ncbi:hypothetical protein [Candidatus Phytoplasma pruni]|uniref:Transmembrane protein n=1 Tax=Candidatus Phytoplasma pruni TaxID=479893 RepID=A0A851HBV6_9MOLU|nr:hypothetical protein [Candidatus Phytoplasma pruni]NWN45501.1 hypothetical protein [Candidatus Phytoplasma pruni]
MNSNNQLFPQKQKNTKKIIIISLISLVGLILTIGSIFCIVSYRKENKNKENNARNKTMEPTTIREAQQFLDEIKNQIISNPNLNAQQRQNVEGIINGLKTFTKTMPIEPLQQIQRNVENLLQNSDGDSLSKSNLKKKLENEFNPQQIQLLKGLFKFLTKVKAKIPTPHQNGQQTVQLENIIWDVVENEYLQQNPQFKNKLIEVKNFVTTHSPIKINQIPVVKEQLMENIIKTVLSGDLEQAKTQANEIMPTLSNSIDWENVYKLLGYIATNDDEKNILKKAGENLINQLLKFYKKGLSNPAI